MGFPPHSLSASKLADLRAAERQDAPFLAFKDGAGELRLELLADVERMTVGRSERNGLALPWDSEVSRTHAQLELVGDHWTLVDESLSRNGSFVNGERLVGRRRLEDGDMVRIGRTSLLLMIGILVWNKAARPIVLLLGVGLHLGIDMTLRIGFFSVAILTAYLVFLSPAAASAGLLAVRDRYLRLMTARTQRVPRAA